MKEGEDWVAELSEKRKIQRIDILNVANGY
jgi:hypothetical protein